MRKIDTRLTGLAAAGVMSVVLAGCGGSPSASTTPDYKGIFTTAVDCGESGKISYEDCSAAMSKAVDAHEKDAPTYSSQRACIAKEGEGKCEFTAANGRYRPRLLAFLVTASKPPVAKPLYAHAKGKPGFRDISNNEYTIDTEELAFSEHAQTMFEAQAAKKKR